MKKRRTTVLALIVVGLVGVIYAAREHYIGQPNSSNPHMHLGAYREGMTLREVYDTFPRYGGGRAKLRLLEDNTVAWAARWDILDKASESIDISYFILKQDVFGAAFLGHLLRKAEQGVKVRILLDAFGTKLSWHLEGNDYLDTLVNTGNVEVRMFRPLLNRAIEGLLNMSLAVAVASEHDKILVVDGKYAITGGRNIATEYFVHPDEAEMVFTDLGVEVHDRGVARALTAAFEAQYQADSAKPVTRERVDLQSQRHKLELSYQAMDRWLRKGRVPDALAAELQEEGLAWPKDLARAASIKGSLRQALPPYVEAETRILDSTTRFKSADDIITQASIRLVKSARKEIFIQNPYVVVADEAIDVFAEASQHGVPIVLFTNSPVAADSAVSQAFFLEQWPRLLAGIPSLRLYANAEDEMIHAKLATFDGVLSLVGTYNLSPLSMATNSEVVLAVWSPELAKKLTATPRARLAAGKPHVYQYLIVRNAEGSAQLDEEGAPIVEFGPRDHANLDDMKKLQTIRKAVKAAGMLPGVSTFF